MARKRTGQVRFRGGKWTARVTVAKGKRQTFTLPTCTDQESARSRAGLLADIAGRLRDASQLDLAPSILERAASCPEGRLGDVERVVAAALVGNAAKDAHNAGLTFKDLATKWTKGELARDYPDHVKVRRSIDKEVMRLDTHVYPLVGHVPVADFTIDHAEQVMRALPSGFARATRRHVAQLLHRVLGLAVYPTRLIESNPLPRGWLPSPGKPKALTFLFPDEDATLLGCTDVPLAHRVLYGFLAREGMRKGEALSLCWRDLDLERGAVTLDMNKSDDPRAWAMSAGVAEALQAWHDHCDPEDDDERVFAGLGDVHASTLREHLSTAGVERAQLFERSKVRQPMRLHDLRATFVTLALAHGRSEAWVADRTGHRSSQMINRYRRAARTVAELGLAELGSLVDAIPEFKRPPKGAEGGGGTSEARENATESTNGPRGGMADAVGLKPTDLRVIPVRTRAGPPTRIVERFEWGGTGWRADRGSSARLVAGLSASLSTFVGASLISDDRAIGPQAVEGPEGGMPPSRCCRDGATPMAPFIRNSSSVSRRWGRW